MRHNLLQLEFLQLEFLFILIDFLGFLVFFADKMSGFVLCELIKGEFSLNSLSASHFLIEIFCFST